MIELVTAHGADATRLSCADAGDLLEDANFEIAKADQGVLKITTLENYLQKTLTELHQYRSDAKDDTVAYFDEVFEN
jgi:leucyl-tRNA synthetase